MMEQGTTIHHLLDQRNGVLMASIAAQAGLHRQRLTELVKAGVPECAGQGYMLSGGVGDELFSLQHGQGKLSGSMKRPRFCTV